jgi:hypothetical protein
MRKGGKDGGYMRCIAVSVIVVACLLCAVEARARDLRSEMMSAPLERQLTFLNDPNSSWAKLDPLVVARFRSLLDQLVQGYTEDEGQIANLTVKTQGALESYGISETLLNIMEGMNTVGINSGSKRGYKDTLTAYIVLRNKWITHEDAVAGLREILESLQSHGKAGK